MYRVGTPTKAKHWIAKATAVVAIAGAAALALPASAEAAAPPASAQAPAAPDVHRDANPRISPCGGARSTVFWGLRYIQIIGNAWDTCGSGSYVQIFMSWYSPTYHNQLVGTAGPGRYIVMNWRSSTTLSPGRIKVTACEHYNGWHCGTPVPV